MDRNNLKKLCVHYLAPYFPLKPSSLFVSPTLRCNSKCSHCDVWRVEENPRNELSPEQWKRIFSNDFFDKITALWLSGGEPVLRKDLAEIALYAFNSLPRLESITLATNALAPAAVKNFLEEILPLADERKKYIHLHISLDGPPEIHDAVRGIKGAFSSLQTTVDIVKGFKSRTPMLGFSFNCVIQEKNLLFLSRTYDVAAELGGTITFNVQETRKSFYRRQSTEQFNKEDKERIMHFLDSIMKDCDVFYRRHYETIISILKGGKRSHLCNTLEATFYIDPDGTVYSCPVAYRNIPLSLFDVPPKVVWNKLFKIKKEIRGRYCPTCLLGCSFGEGLSIFELLKTTLKREVSK